MKKVAIYVCGEVSKKCTANGCLRTFNQKEDSFKRYEDIGCQLVGFNNCNGCDENPVESLKVKIEKLKKADVDTIHLSTCIRGRCDHYEEFAKEFAKHFDVIGYTHGSSNGKKNNNVNIDKYTL
ncbi:CGGC domain-containing protein [Tepidibacter hydrothermalis]|uniref:CGGC domain-containing protein n=1 Tax=Tepidibacter hydrothermalis TaxID=3036126 RepID=A0ABY8EF78_9FIRM|nr:CGGC domain-containing protein [Tepidibacter hydrothermalis]WFD11591.1 CGGC domain-containing protein [Tepidibacter hydrothermalis]